MFLKSGVFAALLVLLSACNPLSPTSTSTATTTDQHTSAGTGKIVGVLLDEAGQPIAELGVFLADLSEGPEPGSKIVSFKLQSSKQGLTDQQGNFVLEEVPPGSYTLAIWTPNSSMLIPAPGGAEGSAIEVNVVPGKVTNVGTLRMKRPV